MKTVAIALLTIGITMTIVTGFDMAREERLVEASSMQMKKKVNAPIYWSPVTGVVFMSTALIMLGISKRQEKTKGKY